MTYLKLELIRHIILYYVVTFMTKRDHTNTHINVQADLKCIFTTTSEHPVVSE